MGKARTAREKNRTMTRNPMKIVTWNANGILNKLQTFELFLNNHDVDICLVSETHITSKNYINIKNYKVYNAIHPDDLPKGGSAVIIKNNFDHFEVSKIETNSIQASIIRIVSLKQALTVGAAYCTPNLRIHKESFQCLLSEMGDRFIIGGDFNAKHLDWGSRITLTRGKILREVIRDLGCEFHSTGKPTYWPTDRMKIPDLLDFFISKRVSSNYISIEDNYDLNSDHSPVILKISERITEKVTKPKLTNKTTNWERFKAELELTIDLTIPLNTDDELDIAVEEFLKNIQSAAWKSTRIFKTRKTTRFYPEHIISKVKEKRKARKRWQQTRDPSHKRALNNLTKQLTRDIKRWKENTLKEYLQNLSSKKEQNYSLWKVTKNKNESHCPPIKKSNGSWAKSNKEKADVFANHLAGIFTPNSEPSDIDISNMINTNANRIPLVRRKELLKIISKLDSKKAPGFDLITAELIKNLPKKATVQLTRIFNGALKLGHFPSAWKVAEIIMILKPGKIQNEVTSYRPISLLPMLSKLLEIIILNRIQLYIDRCKIIPNHQFGFRRKHSTIDQIHRITDLIEKVFEQKQICSAVFLDVAQAFDKVWHAGLLYKLNKFLPKSFVNLLSSYLSDRVFRVRQDNEYSELKDISAGVPQGSILGPTLYLIFTSDLPGTENTTIATFADDTAILATGPDIAESTSKLQTANDCISNWCKTWKIKLNEAKSVHVNFTLKKILTNPRVKINNVEVPQHNTAKYLGMTLDTKLHWKEHVKIKRKQLDLKYKELYWLIGRRSTLSIYNKTLVYNQILKPIWCYGIPIWGCAKQLHIKSIQTFQNKVIRNIVNCPWYVRNSDLHRDLKIPYVKDEIQNYANKHIERLFQHVNEEASIIARNQANTRRLHRTIPSDLC